MPMKKKFTLKENSKHCLTEPFESLNPQKSTIDFLKQYVRIYSVEKCKDGSFIGLVLN